MLNQLHSNNCCLLLLSSKYQVSRWDLLAKHQLPCSKSLAGCSPCSRHPVAAWAELLHSPAGWWPARSRSSYWPEPPSCGGTDVNITARQTHMRLEDGNIETYRQTYLDSSSRSLAPPVNCSFLRCQFISWICFLIPPPGKEMTVKHTKKWVGQYFLQGRGSPQFLELLLSYLNHERQVAAGGRKVEGLKRLF